MEKQLLCYESIKHGNKTRLDSLSFALGAAKSRFDMGFSRRHHDRTEYLRSDLVLGLKASSPGSSIEGVISSYINLVSRGLLFYGTARRGFARRRIRPEKAKLSINTTANREFISSAGVRSAWSI